ncbi:MAG: hypothetical protein DRO13_03200 [Thermoprotei archaeon]|nr:MAG: hypothetical protein DRO13_03200 [Thermoprotei archaeon]
MDLIFTDNDIMLGRTIFLVEFIDNIKPIGSVKIFLKRGRRILRVRELKNLPSNITTDAAPLLPVTRELG